MLRITEHPKGRYNIYDEDTDQGIDNLTIHELEIVKLCVEGILVAKMPEPNAHVLPPLRAVLNKSFPYTTGG
jgi:hypothetical protein